MIPEHLLPSNLEVASLYTGNNRVGTNDGYVDIVTVIITKPGSQFSLLMLADDAIKWGEQLMQAGRNAKSGLIVP
jgi:hypothetical protein